MKNSIWFQRKRYGWGWTPCSWQGRLTTFLFVASILGISIAKEKTGYLSNELFWGAIVLLSAILLAVCYLKGEKPRWTWGEKKDE